MAGTEHLFEGEVNAFSNKLFYKDQLNVFELYNGLLRAHAQNKELGLEQSIKHIESKHAEELKENEQYK